MSLRGEWARRTRWSYHRKLWPCADSLASFWGGETRQSLRGARPKSRCPIGIGCPSDLAAWLRETGR